MGTIADIARLQVDEVRRVGVDVLVDARPERTRSGAGPARAESATSGYAGPGTDGSPLHEGALHEGTLRKGAV